jgi:hypothetical protein
MLFLWIFGNAVCDRMGGRAYVLFYLAGGVVSGVVFALNADTPIIGASGAIAAVTTAFLALYPRVHVNMLMLWIVITTFQVPALILIVFKMVLWDNLLAPHLGEGLVSNVAYSAHLGGYAFGFLSAMGLLLLRVLPRNQFDLLALWGRAQRRAGWAVAGPGTYGPRQIPSEELGSQPLGVLTLDPADQLREQVLDRIDGRQMDEAVGLYRELQMRSPGQILPRRQQLDIANYFKQTGAYAEAVRAYDGFLSAYPTAPEVAQVQLLVGLICHRYVNRPDLAVPYLQRALAGLPTTAQRALAEQELAEAAAKARGLGGLHDTQA